MPSARRRPPGRGLLRPSRRHPGFSRGAGHPCPAAPQSPTRRTTLRQFIAWSSAAPLPNPSPTRGEGLNSASGFGTTTSFRGRPGPRSPSRRANDRGHGHRPGPAQRESDERRCITRALRSSQQLKSIKRWQLPEGGGGVYFANSKRSEAQVREMHPTSSPAKASHQGLSPRPHQGLPPRPPQRRKDY